MADKWFNNFSALVNHLNRNQTNLVSSSNMLDIMAMEGEKLRNIIYGYIAEYYANADKTSPSQGGYVRTGLWLESLQVLPPKIVNGFAVMELTFDPQLSSHPSLWGGEDGFVPLLMETGWHIHWSKPYRINRLSDFEGTHYLTKAVEEYNLTNPYGFIAQIMVDGQPYDGGGQ